MGWGRVAQSVKIATEVTCQVGLGGLVPREPMGGSDLPKAFPASELSQTTTSKIPGIETYEHKNSLQVLNAKETSEAWGNWGS